MRREMAMWILAASVFLLLGAGTAWAEACHYYASPDGRGDGRSDASPFRVADFWTVARPGRTLCLLDGTYREADSMISPPPGLSGASGRPITIRAVNDGAVTIDGQFAHTPIRFRTNAWFVIEGVNAKSGKPLVVWLGRRSDNNTLRRVVAWDATIDHNNAVIGVHGSRGTLLEDVAAFGTARKVFTNSYGGHDVTCRRCWLRWEGSIFGGSRTVSLAYNSTGAVFENVLATWSGESMPETYRPGSSNGHMTDFEPPGPAGIMSVDRIEGAPPKHAHVTVRGSIIYTKTTDRIPTTSTGGTVGAAFPRLTIFGLSSVTLRHVVSVMDPDHPRFNDLLGISLVRRPQNCAVKGASCEDAVVNNTATNLTSIRGNRAIGTQAGDAFGINGVAGKADETDWTVTRASVGTSLAAVQSPWATTIPESGAAVCFRTVNGVITTTPLWPWPMNERIKAATATAGSYGGPCPSCEGGRAARTATDVTASIEQLLGAIPAGCKSKSR